MYKVRIKTLVGTITIYLDTLLQLEDELKKHENIEKVEATKVKKLGE